MTALAKQNAMAVGVGHSFFVFLKTPVFPLHVLPAIKNLNVVTRVYCATANPTKVVVGCVEEQRGVVTVLDGFKPQGFEDDEDKEKRKQFLTMIGYRK
jgi:adenosine/AMP kinase